MALTACSDWLEEPSPGVTKLDDYFSGADAATQNVNGCYAPLQWEYNKTFYPEWFIGDVVSDDALKGGQNTNDMADAYDMENCGALYTTYYTLDDTPDYFYGSLLTDAGQIFNFDLLPYEDGLFLRLPDPQQPDRLQPLTHQPKMFDVFREQHRWQHILGVSTIGQFNEACRQGYTNELINVSEALQEKRFASLADQIAARPEIKVILIAGPSSSGKTTFSKRLSVQLMASGKRPVSISLDDYFVDREKTPVDESGKYDFEHIEAMNIPLFNAQMNALIQGEEVELPRYNFLTGKSEKSGTLLRLQDDTILILEGIHALNPMLTRDIPAQAKFRIYASALTSILLDNHNYIPTTDNRLLRRMSHLHNELLCISWKDAS